MTTSNIITTDQLSGCLVVNLDDNLVTMPTPLTVPTISPRERRRIIKRMDEYSLYRPKPSRSEWEEKEIEHMDLAFTNALSPDEMDDELTHNNNNNQSTSLDDANNTTEVTMDVRRMNRIQRASYIAQLWFDYIVSVFTDYHGYLIYPTPQDPSPDPPFESESFITSVDESHRDWLRTLVTTQAFTRFIEERIYPTSNPTINKRLQFFEEAIIHYRNRTSLFALKQNIPFLIDKSMDITKTYNVLSPDIKDLPSDKNYTYNVFPIFDPVLFITPRATPTLMRVVPFPRPAILAPTSLATSGMISGRSMSSWSSFMDRRSGGRRPTSIGRQNAHSHMELTVEQCVYATWFTSYCALISHTHSTAMLDNAFAVLEHMRTANIAPPLDIFTVIILACGECRDTERVSSVLAIMKQCGHTPDARTLNLLVQIRSMNTEERDDDGTLDVVNALQDDDSVESASDLSASAPSRARSLPNAVLQTSPTTSEQSSDKSRPTTSRLFSVPSSLSFSFSNQATAAQQAQTPKSSSPLPTPPSAAPPTVVVRPATPPLNPMLQHSHSEGYGIQKQSTQPPLLGHQMSLPNTTRKTSFLASLSTSTNEFMKKQSTQINAYVSLLTTKSASPDQKSTHHLGGTEGSGSGGGKVVRFQPHNTEAFMTHFLHIFPGLSVEIAERCPECEQVIDDNAIRAGWRPSSTDLTTQCVTCEAKFIPYLVIVQLHRPAVRNIIDTDGLDVTTPHHMNRSMTRSDSNDNGAVTSPSIDTQTSSDSVPNSPSSSVTSPYNLTSPKSPQFDLNAQLRIQPFSPSNSSQAAEVSRNSISVSTLQSPTHGYDYSPQPSPQLQIQTSVDRKRPHPHIRTTSDVLSTSLIPPPSTAHGGHSPTAHSPMTSPTSMPTPIIADDRVTVAYLSPYVLRKELVSITTVHGNTYLCTPAFRQQFVVLFWNMCWHYASAQCPLDVFMHSIHVPLEECFGDSSHPLLTIREVMTLDLNLSAIRGEDDVATLLQIDTASSSFNLSNSSSGSHADSKEISVNNNQHQTFTQRSTTDAGANGIADHSDRKPQLSFSATQPLPTLIISAPGNITPPMTPAAAAAPTTFTPSSGLPAIPTELHAKTSLLRSGWNSFMGTARRTSRGDETSPITPPATPPSQDITPATSPAPSPSMTTHTAPHPEATAPPLPRESISPNQTGGFMTGFKSMFTTTRKLSGAAPVVASPPPSQVQQQQQSAPMAVAAPYIPVATAAAPARQSPQQTSVESSLLRFDTTNDLLTGGSAINDSSEDLSVDESERPKFNVTVSHHADDDTNDSNDTV